MKRWALKNKIISVLWGTLDSWYWSNLYGGKIWPFKSLASIWDQMWKSRDILDRFFQFDKHRDGMSNKNDFSQYNSTSDFILDFDLIYLLLLENGEK